MIWLTHLWRAIAAYLAARVEPEQDDHGAPDALPAGAAPVDLPDNDDAIVPPGERAQLAPLAVGGDGWLVGDGVIRVPTARAGYRWRTRSGQPGGFLLHWTATQHGTAPGMLRRSASGTGPSVHFWIEDNGTIYQQVPLTRGAGHAGGASSARLKDLADGRIVKASSGYSANSYLIGCEVVQVGEVRWVRLDGARWVAAQPHERGAVAMGWPFGAVDKETGKPRKGPIVRPEQIVEGVDDGRRRLYQDHTPAQLVALERLLTALVDRYGFTDEALSWGHVSVDPTRKRDPGPVWFSRHLPEILARIRSRRAS